MCQRRSSQKRHEKCPEIGPAVDKSGARSVNLKRRLDLSGTHSFTGRFKGLLRLLTGIAGAVIGRMKWLDRSRRGPETSRRAARSASWRTASDHPALSRSGDDAADAVPALALGTIERVIGTAQQCLGRVARTPCGLPARSRRSSTASPRRPRSGRADCAICWRMRSPTRTADGGIGIGHDHDELLAAKPAYEIDRCAPSGGSGARTRAARRRRHHGRRCRSPA